MHTGLSEPGATRARFQLYVDGPEHGAWNMAVDEALMAVARSGAATLRFYTWEPGCVSLGRNQSTPARVQGRSRDDLRPGADVVRRPTGGRSVYHRQELTYSVTVPDRLWGGPRALYRRVNRALRSGILSLGAALDPVPPAGLDSRKPGQRSAPCGSEPAYARHEALGPRPCFRAPAPGEVTAGGRKLVGSAQWRHGGVLLQHGSVLLVNDQRLGDLREVPAERPEIGAVGLSELLPVLPKRSDLIRALAVAFGREFGCLLERAALAPALEGRARELVEKKYRTREWTWRR